MPKKNRTQDDVKEGEKIIKTVLKYLLYEIVAFI